MKLLCPDCGKPIPAEDTNIDTGIAKCRACGSIVNVFQALGLPNPTTTALASQTPPSPGAEVLPRPPQMKVQDNGPDGWSARWRWFKPTYIFLTFFCIAWDGFLVFWYSMAIFGPHKGGFEIMAIIFPICHVAVGVALTYTVIAGYLNQTFVTLDNMNLTIRHAPVPWLGNRVIPIDTIRQLYCKAGKWQKNNSQTYELWVAFKEGDAKCLLTLDDDGSVRFLEQQLEAKLGIPNERVPGELPP